MDAKGSIKELQIEAVITRADGTVVDLGTIASSAWEPGSEEEKAAAKRIKAANSKLRLSGYFRRRRRA